MTDAPGDARTDARTPARIHADRAAGTLAIDWADGHHTEYGAIALRWLCPCAFCRGEAGLPGWLDSRPVLDPEQTRLVDIQLVGQYALAPTWGDGHHTGYYPFALLRDRCPCPTCTKRRAAEGGDGTTDRGGHEYHAPTERSTERTTEGSPT
ncbi:MAG TPA: DUF971 domain-containing protein [Candidatus Binatia bacterium]|nr:DUF971 domain-containing protein [Candidatus Binatia bacterium]